VLILPYMDQSPGYARWDITRRYAEQPGNPQPLTVPAYFCPARRNPGQLSVSYTFASGAGPTLTAPPGGIGDYASVAGTVNNDGALCVSIPYGVVNGAKVSGTGPFNNSGPGAVITSFHRKTRLTSITDGTSNTLLIGEKYIRPNSFQGKNEDRSIYDGNNQNNFRRFLGRQVTSYNPMKFDPADPPNPLISDMSLQSNPIDPASGLVIPLNQCFGGPHPGQCLFVLCDGSVRGVGVNVPIGMLTLLGVPDDGQPVRFD